MADVKLSAAQKRALEKFTPGEVRTVMGLNGGTLEALETRCLVIRGKAALDTSWSNRAKHILVEAVASPLRATRRSRARSPRPR